MTDTASRLPARLGLVDSGVAVGMNILWGLNIVAMKVTVGATAPFMAGSIRLAAVFLICLPFMRRIPGRTRMLALLGLINGGIFVLFFNLSLKVATNVGALAIAGQLSVPISVILGVVLLGERIALFRVGGIVLAFAGVAMLVFDPRIARELPGLLLMICAATSWATSSLLQRRLAGVPVLTMYGWTGLMGLLLLLPLSLLTEPQALARAANLGWQPIAWFAFSIFGSTLLGQGGLAWLLGRHPLTTIMPLTLLATVVSVLASHFFFATPITGTMIIGGLVALCGVVIVTVAAPRPVPPIEA
jgi:O-acetylserine/cysteine efflux transporter